MLCSSRHPGRLVNIACRSGARGEVGGAPRRCESVFDGIALVVSEAEVVVVACHCRCQGIFWLYAGLWACVKLTCVRHESEARSSSDNDRLLASVIS